MAKQDKLITYAYMREECDLPVNLDDDRLEHGVYQAQEMVRGITGPELFTDFLENYRNKTLSAVYTTLLPYIKQFVAWQACEFFVSRGNIMITRAGFRIHQEDNSQPATAQDLAAYTKTVKQQAAFFRTTLERYLNDNSTTYPLYRSSGCSTGNTGSNFSMTVVSRKDKYDNDYSGRKFKVQ